MLKKYIRSMLESYRGSHKSVPTPTGLVYQETTLNPDAPFSYVPQKDGWCSIQTYGACDTAYVKCNEQMVAFASSAGPVGGGWPCLSFQAKKGDTYVYRFTASDGGSKKVAMVLFPYVGS